MENRLKTSDKDCEKMQIDCSDYSIQDDNNEGSNESETHLGINVACCIFWMFLNFWFYTIVTLRPKDIHEKYKKFRSKIRSKHH